MAQSVLLSRLPTYDRDSGEVTAVIETPKGSRNKYDYEESCAAFMLKGVMPEGIAFPYDFGFFPSTLGEDGDPLDVLVFLDAPAITGCVLTVRLIGVIEAEQGKKGEEKSRNDRLLAVATHARTHEHVRTLDDLRPNMLEEIEAFFRHYNDLNGKVFTPLGRAGPERARQLLDAGMRAFREGRRRE